jgi:pimeloyl-CoA synthetase
MKERRKCLVFNNIKRRLKMKVKAYRHGEIAFVGVERLPDKLPEKTTSKTIAVGSNNNPHNYDNGDLYLIDNDDYTLGYFVAQNTTLFHMNHGIQKEEGELREAKLPDGVYEIRRQNEWVNNELRPVED